MANIVITQKCIRSCPYCFASKYLKDEGGEFMSWDNFLYVLDFYRFNGNPSVSIMGGEPSIHPHFLEFLEYALKRMSDLTIFTSGIMSHDKVLGLKELLNHKDFKKRTHIVCNMNEPAITPAAERARLDDFLAHVGDAVCPGFNIYKEDFDLSFLFLDIARYRMRRRVRLSMAHPIYGKDNAHIAPDRFVAVVERLASFLPQFEAMKTIPALDCGFPICAFSDEILGKFARSGATFHWQCAPVIDIGPDLSIWPCFPLFAYNKQSLFDFNTFHEINEFFIKLVQHETRGNLGVFEECDSCEMTWRELCSGGCLANYIPADNIRLLQAP